MKQKRNICKAAFSFFLAVLLTLQSVPFTDAVYAVGTIEDSAIAVDGEEGGTEGLKTATSSEASEASEPEESEEAEELEKATSSEAEKPGPKAPQEPLVNVMNLQQALESGDKTQVIKDANDTFTLKILQGSPAVEIPENGTLNGRSNFTIELTNIKVPTLGDITGNDGSDIIIKGDTVILSKEDFFPGINLTETNSRDINIGSLKIATATFTPEAITIRFNGDDTFFGGGKRDVTIALRVTAKAADQTPGKEIDTDIFRHSYKLQNAALVPQYGINLICNSPSGHYSWISGAAFKEGAIEWKAVVTAVDASDPSIQMPLNGLMFSEALATAGTYVEDSFKVSKVEVVDGVDKTPISVDGAEPTVTGSNLRYTFPNDFGEYKAVITFKTWIPKEKYYSEYHGTNGGLVDPNINSNQSQSVLTSAKLLDTDGSSERATTTAVTAALTPDWIQQYGKVSKSGNDTLITWTIDVNKRNHHRANTPRSDLQGMTIEDVLPAGTEFVSATYKVNDIDKGAINPTDNVFSIGDANGPVQLVIVSKVTGNQTGFTNIPKAKWKLDQTNSIDQDNDVGVTASTTVTIGAHAFSKSGTWVRDAASTRWTINLTLQYDVPDATVYDLLIYGGSRDVLNSLDENPKVSNTRLAAIKGKIDDNQLWRKYRADTLKATGLTGEVITLTAGGVAVADLIKVTGFKGETAGTVSFESIMTNPDHLFRQDGGGERWNRALFFDGDSYVSQADASDGVHIRMLNKEMLYAAKPLDASGREVTVHGWRRKGTEFNIPAINHQNWYTSNNFADNLVRYGYDQATRTVTFRLAINQAGFNTDTIKVDGGSRVASEIQLVDTLPAGWEFVEYAPGKKYELLACNPPNGGVDGGYFLYVNAGAVIAPGDPKHVVSSFTANGNVGTFTFSKLGGTYVILVKARPTNDALATYQLGDNKMTNTAEFSMKWGDTVKSATETHPVIVPFRSLSKTVRKPVSGVQEWTVNYTPPFHMKQGVYLQDTLGAGLQLRKDVDGSLSLAPSDLAVYKGKLKADGTLERDGAPLNLKDTNCEVKVSVEWGDSTTPTRLKFQMDDPNQLYLLVYQTESKGMTAGATAGNKIELLGDDTLPQISAQSSIVLDSSDVSGNAADNGILYLKKVDPDGKPLAGVKFELFNPDGTPAENKDGSKIGEKTTDASGKTSFIIQMPGLYQLKQTYIDETTWLPTTTVYWVRVIDAPGCPVLVDGVKADVNNPHVVPTPATGKLTIKNTVDGNGAEPDKDFEFTITFAGEGKDASYSYTKSDGTTGRIKSGDTILLKHNQTVQLPKLLEELKYTVTQKDYTSDGYTTNPVTFTYTGTIEKNGDHKAEFLNRRMLEGDLFIENSVKGSGSDKSKDFEYTIAFDGAGKDGSYAYDKSDGTKGTIKSGDKIKLKDGQSITIKDILKDTVYTVTEDDYTSEGYITEPSSRIYTGTIETKQTAKAPFVNSRQLPGTLELKTKPASDPGEPKDSSKVPGDGKHPALLIATLVDENGKPVKDATVKFYDKDGAEIGTAITDINGKAQYSWIPPKVVDTVQKEYPFTAVTTATSPSGVPYKKSNEVKVLAAPAELFGILRDNTTGEIIPNAEITVRNEKTGTPVTIKTDENGEYRYPVNRDEEYTITYFKKVKIGGVSTPIPFTQKADTNGLVMEGQEIPADITAVGIVLFKQPNNQTSKLGNELSSKMKVYLKDETGNYVKENGVPKAFPLDPVHGTFAASGLSEQTYTMEVRCEVGQGQELVVAEAKLNVKADGELNISEELVDPYGTITDKNTKEAIKNAEVTLYYADTPRNRAKGITPGTKVTLPAIPGFAPNDNLSPSQKSDASGKYAYMVYPDTDYYLVVTKDGYVTHTSGPISVGVDIVLYDVELEPAGGKNSGSSGSGGSTGSVRARGTVNIGGPGVPKAIDAIGVIADDTVNVLKNVDSTMEYSVDGGNWLVYDPANAPDLSGNHTVQVRVKADGNVPSGAITTLYFTDNNPIARGAKTGNKELAGLPKTGDNGTFRLFYMMLALAVLMTAGIYLSNSKKRETE
ncbi:MAG: DUF4073 domain-containing protein [Lacrimispora sp.]|uniref:DUF4073 domain-containing protein n=1 Tax=Lacrimispora sp. TaxID=2719234 RepID=UPI0039E6AF5B